ncbi:hypothetical protein J4216_05645 [Candidatus Woesearchaeota archaeon]|nr:hypothetical protein [Candidatus Woesearchaeota archaeon]
MQGLIRLIPTSILHNLTMKKIQDYKKFKKFFLKQDPDDLELIRRKYLLYTFSKNSQRIPHYKKFLEKNNFDPKSIKSVEDFMNNLPETDKHNYVFNAERVNDLCVDGDYHNISMLVKSSGHSGRQCYWVRSHKADSFGKVGLTIGLDENFNITNKKTLIINGFILGSWVTGITFSDFASSNCPVINIGANKEEILQTINEIGNQFEQIIITGYPPFVKELVDYGIEIKFPWKKHDINFAVGGEDFPESWRDYIQKITYSEKIRSGFGASDIGILGGIETDDTVYIRRLADTNEKIKKALFGDVEDTPMLFQYPLSLFAYQNKNRELIFTSILPEDAEPMINYNLKDIGGVITYRNMQQILLEFGISRKFNLPLSFLYVVGRKDGSVKFHAFLIYPENIQEAIYKDKNISKFVTGKFHIKNVVSSDHEHKLRIDFELRQGAKKNSKIEQEFSNSICNTLQNVNEGYKLVYNRIGKKAMPLIVLHEFGKFPYQSNIKNKYN